MAFAHAKTFNATPPTDIAILPAAPYRCDLPLSQGPHDVETHQVLTEIAALHLAAFVTAHGPPPQSLAWEPILYGEPDALRAGHMIRLQGRACARSAAWMAAAGVGLETWAQAGWSNPVVREPGPHGFETWWAVPLTEVAAEAACRLKRSGRIEQLRNLAAHHPGLLAARLDPESPLFKLPVARQSPQRG